MIKDLDKKRLKTIASYTEHNASSGCPLAKPEEETRLFSVKDREALEESYNCWLSLGDVREERNRNIRYKNGDQWSDIVEDPEFKGRKIREEQLLLRGGRTPLKHNFIQQFIRNLTGQMLGNSSQSVVIARTREQQNLSEMLTNTLQVALKNNNTEKLDIATIEELLLGGISCMKIRYDYFSERGVSDVKINYVNISRLFFNSDIEDPRMDDIRLIGEFHDYTLSEAVSIFANSPDEEEVLRTIFSVRENENGFGMTIRKDFEPSFYATDPSKCRVYEIWQKASRRINYLHDYADGIEEKSTMSRKDVDKINTARLSEAAQIGIAKENVPLIKLHSKTEQYWEVKFLASDGTVLRQHETPYAHKEHPYVISVMPMTNGRFKGMISDLIDIQRHINRLLVMQDFIIGSSAKGVLMIPENAIPDGCSVQDFADEYVKIDGVIVYKPNSSGEKPFQVTRNATDTGAWQMLDLQMRMINEISGVSGAMQGHRTSASTPSSLYQQQAVNSLVNHRSLFSAFSSGEKKRDEKVVKVILQYYNEPRVIAAMSTKDLNKNNLYRPSMVQEIESFNLVLSQSIDTPVYRQINEDILLNLLNNRLIPLDIYLQNSSQPFAEQLLMQLETRKKEELERKEAIKLLT